MAELVRASSCPLWCSNPEGVGHDADRLAVVHTGAIAHSKDWRCAVVLMVTESTMGRDVDNTHPVCVSDNQRERPLWLTVEEVQLLADVLRLSDGPEWLVSGLDRALELLAESEVPK